MDWEIGSNRIERPHFQVCCDWYVHGSKPPPPQVFCAATRTVSPPISKLKKSTLGFNLLQLGSWDILGILIPSDFPSFQWPCPLATMAGARALRHGTWPMRRGPSQSCRSWRRRRSFRRAWRKSGGNPWGSIGFYHNFHCFL